MAKRISIFNQKGGVGKTSLALNIAYWLAEFYKKRVLYVDNDPQGNSTSFLTHEEGVEITFFSVMMNDNLHVKDAIVNVRENFDLLGSDIRLANFDQHFEPNQLKKSIVKRNLKPILDDYDYIIIDNNPSLSLLPINSLVASSHLFVVSDTSNWSLDGIEHIENTFEEVKQNENFELEFLGCVLNNAEKNRNSSMRARNILKDFYGKDFLDDSIIYKSELLKTMAEKFQFSFEMKTSLTVAEQEVLETLKRITKYIVENT